MSILFIWLQFLAAIALIGVAGVQLTRYGDVIADKTGLGGSWIGLILIATVTSLPELANGVSSVTLAHVPDIAVGDVLGSCIFNLLVLVLLDLLYRPESLYHKAGRGHVLSGGFGIFLIGLAGFSLLLEEDGISFHIAHIGWYSPIFVLLYVLAVRTVYHYEMREVQAYSESEPDRYPELSLKAAGLRYGIAAAVVVVAGIWLPFVAEDLAVSMGWTESFVGTLFVALVTSVPELVVTLSALRLDAVDMAIGNLLGSNLFNILVLAVDDALFLPGPLLAHVSVAHATSALSGVMMTGVAMIGLFYRPRGRVLRAISWTSVALLLIYLANTYVVYLHE